MESEYPYQKDRTEAFLTVPLTIKDIESMKDALDKFCSEEYFIDDNKLHIEEHDRKIGVSKKSLFQKLPPTLIFNLKRFEYNTTTWQRYKLNSYFDFPEEIDLKPWCVEDSDPESDPKKYKYKLKGVLVHSGTAEAGHYYSYIKKGEKWTEFNDTTVRNFEPSE